MLGWIPFSRRLEKVLMQKRRVQLKAPEEKTQLRTTVQSGFSGGGGISRGLTLAGVETQTVVGF